MFSLEELQKAEEKKLTDDTEINVGMTDKEVVKALEWALITSSWTANVAGKEQNMFRIILDLINRQKAEIERLTEELDGTVSMNKMYIKEAKQNVELQKRVNELTEQRDVFKKLFEACNNSSITTEQIIDTMNSFYREQAEHLTELKIEQAVKDKAKEILGDLRNAFIEQTSYGCDANQHIGYYDYEIKIGLAIEQIDEYAKEKYGIEYDVEV